MSQRWSQAHTNLETLVDTRIQLHHAVQVAGAAGRSFGTPRPDHRHGALFWEGGLRALAGAVIPAPTGPIRVALGFEPPSLLVLGDEAAGSSALELDGRSIEDAAAWLRARLGTAGLPGDRLVVRTPPDLPPHPGGAGAPVRVDPDAAANLSRWFGFANGVLADAAVGHGRQDDLPVPCWPYHFDLALVIPVGAAPLGDPTVTLGFSPGDTSIAEPYLYVLPWPAPRVHVAETPAPAGGHWQVERWTGLALPATSIEAALDPASLAATFFERGFELARDLLAP